MSGKQVMFFIFFKFYILSYVSVCLCTCECRCQSGPEEGSESLGSGAIGFCKPLQLSAGTWTWVLCKSWSALNCWAIFSSTQTIFLMSELYLYNKLVIPLILFFKTNVLTYVLREAHIIAYMWRSEDLLWEFFLPSIWVLGKSLCPLNRVASPYDMKSEQRL